MTAINMALPASANILSASSTDQLYSHRPFFLSSRLIPDLEKTRSLAALTAARGWRALPERERIGAIYDFVRNDIAFGYNVADDLPASRVLADGIGQCNTKGTLFMALV